MATRMHLKFFNEVSGKIQEKKYFNYNIRNVLLSVYVVVYNTYRDLCADWEVLIYLSLVYTLKGSEVLDFLIW